MQREDERYSEQVLSLALDLGKSMVKCGAEMNRVEETVVRIGYAYGMKKTEVFSVISMIHATVIDGENRTHSQMRRISSSGVNFEKLERLNSLSREICATKPDLNEARARLAEISEKTSHFNVVVCLGYMLASAAFAVFFGGTFLDAVATMPIAAIIYLLQIFIKAKGASRLFFTALESAVAGLLALIFVKLGFGNNVDIIMIGDIMLLIPGLMLINSIREMLCGDMMSGLLRLLESVMMAMAIAVGFALPIYFWGYFM